MSFIKAEGEKGRDNNRSSAGLDTMICAASVRELTRRVMLSLITFIPCFFALSIHANAQSNLSSPLGTNLIEVTYYSSEQPFLNIFKTGSLFAGTVSSGARYDETQGAFQLDVNGYPTSMSGIGPAAGQTFTEIDTAVLYNLGSYAYPSGNYVFLYSGTGTFNFTGDCINSNIIASAPGRIVINIPSPGPSGQCRIQLTSTGSGSSYANNFRFVYSSDSTGSVIGTRETLLNNGELFNPDFINRIKPFKTIRFMKWMNTVGSFETNWANRPTQSYVFWDDANHNGAVPAEVQIALCNEVGADCWFNMPILATDDYVTQFATLAHSMLNSNLKGYVEYGNEIWNNGAFTPNLWTQLVALGYGVFPNAGNDFNAGFIYGILRAVQDGATWKRVWGADGARVVRVIAGQDSYVARNQYILGFTAGMYGGNSGSFSGTAAQNVDAFATGVYFGYPVPSTFTLDQLFTEIMSGGLVSGGYPGGMIKQALDQAAGDYSVASSFGLPMIAYEYGQTLYDPSGSNAALQTLYLAAMRDPRMGTAYTTYFNGWKSLGGELAENFTLSTAPNPYYWGLLENIVQTSSPKYNAVLNFISANPCWWSGCSAAANSSGTSTTPPSVPTGLAGTLASATQINLSWTASTDNNAALAGYNVYRNGTKVGTTASTSYSDTGLSSGTSYAYAVSAHDAAGNASAQSSSISVSTPTPPAVTISSPANGTLLKGATALKIAAAAIDSAGIASIAITSGSTPLMTCSNTTACSAVMASASISQGAHVISATATDKWGLQTSTSITILSLK